MHLPALGGGEPLFRHRRAAHVAAQPLELLSLDRNARSIACAWLLAVWALASHGAMAQAPAKPFSDEKKAMIQLGKQFESAWDLYVIARQGHSAKREHDSVRSATRAE